MSVGFTDVYYNFFEQGPEGVSVVREQGFHQECLTEGRGGGSKRSEGSGGPPLGENNSEF